jgi:integrase
MARVSTKLAPTASGGFRARKRIPGDAQDAYERLYGVRWEALFHCEPMPPLLARAKHREWLCEIETRIANIRAEAKGEGRALTPKEARGLSGVWYEWYTVKHLAKAWSASTWEAELSDLHEDFLRAVWAADGRPPDGKGWTSEFDPFEVWQENPEAKQHARPLVADRAETAQFLHAKNLVLDPASRDLFLDYVCQDLFEAVMLLIRRANGDYTPDTWPERFPKFERTADPSLTPWMLFERWIAEAKPADSTIDRWRGVFLKLRDDFPGHSAAALTPEEVQKWARGLVSPERSARTVNDVWIVAGRTIFGWAVKEKLVTLNPFEGARITVPRKNTTREHKAFSPQEIKNILGAAQAISSPRSKTEAAKRWVPWLCAYTGARSGEMTQLRGADVIVEDGVHALKITPEAGTVKNKRARTVPLHEHLIEQDFLSFVDASGKGPLFYNVPKQQPAADDPTNPRKRRYIKAREHLAAWVRGLGVTDPEVQPNHAWRHTFKQIGHRHGVQEHVLDAIVGHAPISVGRGYGEPTLRDKADALKKFPRYDLADNG